MPKQSLVTMTEPMLYILMALRNGPKCGVDISEIITTKTEGRVNVGPATLYTLLNKFQDADYIVEIDKDKPGRKRTYQMTILGKRAYANEIKRLQSCIMDAKATEKELAEDNVNKTQEFKTITKIETPATSTNNIFKNNINDEPKDVLNDTTTINSFSQQLKSKEEEKEKEVNNTMNIIEKYRNPGS